MKKKKKNWIKHRHARNGKVPRDAPRKEEQNGGWITNDGPKVESHACSNVSSMPNDDVSIV